ncbi:MAG: tetratricopeptide repeat protein [Candidatus Latescibacter sp.]|nr:tetratricopeptide repeat protein [Candidatus Latescibacter sp.]
MHITKRYTWIVFCALGTLILGIGILATSGESTKATTTSPDNEIVLTIGEIDRSALNEGDTLRKAHKYKEAIVAYQKVLDTQGIAQSVRAEAEYDIGLSHAWLGEFDKAGIIFAGMLTTYKDDPDAIGYTQFCLAWLEVQKGKYRDAITRLEGSLVKANITDQELAAQTQLMIGRTYLLFLNNPVNAQLAFKKVRDKYPDTRAAKHPYVKPLDEN